MGFELMQSDAEWMFVLVVIDRRSALWSRQHFTTLTMRRSPVAGGGRVTLRQQRLDKI